MHQQFANAFYNSPAWRACRAAYKKARGGLCEQCLARGLIVPGVEVHHKRHLTPDNLDDPDITLSWDNLQLLCKPCHDTEHRRDPLIRTDKNGHVAL